MRVEGFGAVAGLEGSCHRAPLVSAFATVQEGGPLSDDGGVLVALAAQVLEGACLLATDPVAGVAALGTALLRQIGVEVAVASLPGPRAPSESVPLTCSRGASPAHRSLSVQCHSLPASGRAWWLGLIQGSHITSQH